MNNLRLRFMWPLWLFGFLSAMGANAMMGHSLSWFFSTEGVLLGGGVFLLSFLMAGWLLNPTKAVMNASCRLLKGLPPEHETASWLPEEFWRVRTDVNLMFSKHRQALKAAEDHACQAAQRLQHAERLVREAFGAMQGLFAASDEGVAVVDAQGNIIASNERLDTLLGHPVEDLVGRDGTKLTEVLSDRFEAQVAVDVWFEDIRHDPEREADLRGELKGDKPSPAEIRTVPMKADDGSILGRIWILRDRSKMRGLEQQLRESQKLGNLGLIAGGIAHDFNNLLTAITGNITLAEMTPPERSSEVRTRLDHANQAAERAAQLVKQLLSYSRRGNQAHEKTNIKRAVASVEALLKHSVDPRVTVRTEAGMEPSMVFADSTQIVQVLLNLGLNARDALPEKNGIIEMAVSNVSQNHQGKEQNDCGDYVVICVRDNGHGIDPEDQQRVFEAFFTTKPEGKGTGLGLATAQDIVREHGGWIEFDSELGRGTEFRVYLPRLTDAAELDENHDAPATPSAMPSGFTRSGPRKQVLVVDDEAPVRAIATNMLTFLGYEVIEASDGQEALEQLQQKGATLDAVLLDIYMPKMSGRETFQQMRLNGCELPVVICSGFVIDPDEFTLLSEGGEPPAHIMVKPYTLDGLRQAMARALPPESESEDPSNLTTEQPF